MAQFSAHIVRFSLPPVKNFPVRKAFSFFAMVKKIGHHIVLILVSCAMFLLFFGGR